ncbi:DUF6626 family protein [Reyranella sp.]|uniref:DUF6626 family protein n=1 Tax=Reyranella sp. TaxID=1929291 RepID=UPI0027243B07|nr:DUF6626 family protein [Reyranella sp.]MDO8973820.1 hypothetical protein [Reyranella sp.]
MNITAIYHQLRDIGVVKSQYEFSKLCGRRNTWFSSIKARNRSASVSAVYTLANNLKSQAQRSSPIQLDLAVASAQLFKQLDKRCRASNRV